MYELGQGPLDWSVPEGLPEGRCGRSTNYRIYKEFPSDVTCWRHSWDESDDGRCIWHTDTADKPAGDLVEARTDTWERLDGAVLPEADLGEDVSFASCSMVGADLTDADLGGADLTDADLLDADLTRSTLWSADLTNADLRSAHFTDANHLGADLTDADLRNVDFDGANLKQADLSGVDLRGSSFAGARLHETFLDDVRCNADTDLRDVYAYDLPGLQPAEVDTRADRLRMNVRTARHYLSPRQETDTDPQKAVRVHRKLQQLIRENALPGEVPHHYVREKHARRRQAIVEGDYLRWGYAALQRWVMGYGERPWRVVGLSLLTILTFGVLYPFFGGIRDAGVVYRLDSVGAIASAEGLAVLARGLYFSTITFTTIGYANVAPIGAGSRLLVGIESFAGALLMAMLVFVLGRRSTR